MNVVWFKRDLRTDDHRPLLEAAKNGAVLPLYIVEPHYWQQPDTSERQWQFIRESLLDLNTQLSLLCHSHLPLQIGIGKASQILHQLQQRFGAITLYSHEETGNLWTYERDKYIATWCKAHRVTWHQFAQFGVKRPLADRDHWAEHWHTFMASPLLTTPTFTSAPLLLKTVADLPKSLGHDRTPCPNRQAGGSQAATQLWQSFTTERGEYYFGSLGTPRRAQNHCSRLSPHFSYGTVSLSRIVQETLSLQKSAPSTRWQRSLGQFESRLWWHCHFIQKLEDQPDMEKRCLHPAYAGLRSTNPHLWQAWHSGQTGWPFVDACMRYLIHHGWINFRMRAMLMSIAAYPLWLPWQQPAQRLAQLFTDYEPGIHYPQVQMQSGTTGINIPRIYNPTKQGQKQDPFGDFTKRWLPELAAIPTEWLFTPWLLTPTLQKRYGVIINKDYPQPVVDFDSAVRQAKQAISSIKHGHYKTTAKAIGQKHGSRKRRRTTTVKIRNKDQLTLFD